MNNNEMKFDPATGKPINTNNTNNTTQNQTVQPITTQENQANASTQQNQAATSTSQNLQTIATVDQSSEKFINNVQQNNEEKISAKEEKSSFVFIFILFAIIFAVIFFLFPIISKLT